MRVLTKSEVAKTLGVSTKTVEAMVESRELPQPILVSKSKRWPEIELKRYVESKMAERDAQVVGGA